MKVLKKSLALIAAAFITLSFRHRTDCIHSPARWRTEAAVKAATIDDCSLLTLPRHSERSGSLTSLENSRDIPFDVKRIFYLYDIPGGENRGGHAHKECHQMLVAASGAFDVKVSDGKNEKIYRLDRPYYGLHVPPGVWAEELNFSSGSICLVLTSHEFDESDYWRSYDKYLEFKKA